MNTAIVWRHCETGSDRTKGWRLQSAMYSLVYLGTTTVVFIIAVLAPRIRRTLLSLGTGAQTTKYCKRDDHTTNIVIYDYSNCLPKKLAYMCGHIV